MSKVIDLEQNSPEWFQFRLGKITGSRLGSIWSSRAYTKDDIVALLESRGVEFKKSATKKVLEDLLTEEDKEYLASDSEKKLEWYQVMADQVAITVEEDEEKYLNAMERGHELEDEAAQKAAEILGVEVYQVGCIAADEDERIINSPDRVVGKKTQKKIKKEMEVKCLSAAKHLMAFFERRIPEEYWTQKVQYFVTAEDLDTCYWVFYNPRVPILPIFILVVKRDDLGHWPDTMRKYQKRTLKDIDAHLARLIEESNVIILPARPEKVAGLPA